MPARPATAKELHQLPLKIKVNPRERIYEYSITVSTATMTVRRT